MDARDPLAVARALIQCPSVTPAEAGSLDVLQNLLEPLGFVCTRRRDGPPGAEIDNLFARLGEGRPHLCFAGHTDVVPPGDEAAWSAGPFAAEVRDGELIGRGACDMKGGVACSVAALARHVAENGRSSGSLSLLVTTDEEGKAEHGTRAVVRWLAETGQAPDACILGEPTNPSELGDLAKIGRRGSLTGELVVEGRQGHTAYPGQADNPIPRLLAMLQALLEPLDGGTDNFEPSDLQITSIDVGNPTRNVIPARVRALFNVRFNDRFTADTLEAALRRRCEQPGGRFDLFCESNADAFVTPPGALSEQLCEAVEAELGRRPTLGTAGGTSDARFIKDLCPVVEFGLVGATMHGVDERVRVADLETLTRIYQRVIDRFFQGV